jgi:flavin-dependent dehydrogenase
MHDVAIIGGGLAGLTLALQVKQQAPDLSVVVLERNSFPVPAGAHKVGEATVEIGAHYLAHTLGLEEYLEKQQLRKFGLRLFFGAGYHDDLSAADELGASSLLPAISYQLDRGKLENDLAALLEERGIELRTASVVKKVEIGDEHHALTVLNNGAEHQLQSRWIVDASARSGVLKRTLGLAQPSSHKMCSAWFRIESDFSVDEWSTNDDWLARCNGASRRPSTNHLMGSGYWIWIIPLAGGTTSVGLVTDPDLHPLDTYDTYAKLLDWLAEHQPMLSRQLAGAEPLDFLKLKNLSHGCEHLWSADRWAITGEAGFFADPFYSPGTDFIGLSNTFIADLITRDCSAPELGIRLAVYEKMYRSFYESTMTLYERQYAGFGDARLMAVKLTWDYAYYWSILAWLFFREVLTDLHFLRAAQPDIERIRALNNDVQAAFRKRAKNAIVDRGKGRFFDQIAVPSIVGLNAALLEPSDDLAAELRQNCARLEELAPRLLNLLAGEPIGNCDLLGDLEQRIAATVRDNRSPA